MAGWKKIVTASSSIDDLSDVNSPSPTGGDVLVWQSGTSSWVTSDSLQEVITILKKPTTDTTSLEADTSTKITLDKTLGSEIVTVRVNGQDVLEVLDDRVVIDGSADGGYTLPKARGSADKQVPVYTASNHTAAWAKLAPEDLGGNYSFPSADGTSGQVLQTNGSGTLSFVTPSSGVTASGTPSNNQLAVWTTASEIEGDNNLTWTGTQFNIAGGAILSADLIKMNGRAPTSPAAGEVGVGGNVITQFHTTGTVTAGGVYVAGSSAWVQADADAGSTATGLLAVATDAASPAEMLIEGSVKLASNTGFSTASKGDVLYLSLTAGELTSDISSHTTGDFVRVCGYVIDASKNYVYFKPDNTWLEL